MVMPVILVIIMMLPVIMVMCLAKNECGYQVDQQAQHRDDDGFLVLDRLGRQDALDGAHHHHEGHAQEEDGAGETPQHLDLPGAKGEPRVPGVAPRRSVSHRRQADGHRMRAHVPAVGQQGHGVVPPAGGDLDHHHGGGDPHHQTRAPFGGLAANVKDVIVLPVRKIVDMHPRSPYQSSTARVSGQVALLIGAGIPRYPIEQFCIKLMPLAVGNLGSGDDARRETSPGVARKATGKGEGGWRGAWG